MIILGIETSCDDTALALIETRGSGDSFECRIIASLVHSQADLHTTYGGVYPALAKREHGKNIIPLLKKLLEEAELPATQTLDDTSFSETIETFRADVSSQNAELFEALVQADFLKKIPSIDRIAVTEGPGLEPALWVGISFTRILSALWNIPVTPINHMEGHIVGSLLNPEIPHGTWHKLQESTFPALALLISGGHTELIYIQGIGNYSIIGQTKDDAVGEAFDKTARLLGLPYPGGPHISRLAQEARDANIPSPTALPRPMIGSKDLNFSFSGLKTAVLYAVRKAEQEGNFDDTFKKGLAREFEEAVRETLISKIKAALDSVEVHTLIIGGGVSANTYLTTHISTLAAEYSIPVLFPSRHISGDNALMIALAGAFQTTTKTPGEIRAHGTKKLGFNA
jgi:N6-L-threonylcarbamoyladenine synthase